MPSLKDEVNLNIRCTEEFRRALKSFASKHGFSVQDGVIEACKVWMQSKALRLSEHVMRVEKISEEERPCVEELLSILRMRSDDPNDKEIAPSVKKMLSMAFTSYKGKTSKTE